MAKSKKSRMARIALGNGTKRQRNALSMVNDPRIMVRPTLANPKSTTFGRRWQARRVQVLYNSTSLGEVPIYLNGLIAQPLESGVTTDRPLATVYASTTPVKVLAVKVWNRALGADVKVDLDGDVITTGDSSQSVVGTDVGTGTSLAGVSFVIPKVLSQTRELGYTSTKIATVSSFSGVAPTVSTPFRFLVEYTLLMQI